jgi:hypothetical protein
MTRCMKARKSSRVSCGCYVLRGQKIHMRDGRWVCEPCALRGTGQLELTFGDDQQPPARPHSGMRPLSGVLEQTRVMRARRDESLLEDCLYAVGKDGRVIECPVIKWTAKCAEIKVPGWRLTLRVGGIGWRARDARDSRSVVERLEQDGKVDIPDWPGLVEVLGGILYRTRP